MSQFKLCVLCLALGMALVPSATSAGPPLPVAAPRQAGFSIDGLARIDRFFAREIAAGHMPGAVLAVARDGKLVHYKAYGKINGESAEAMPLDAVFPLASMSKIMVSVGALALNEEGLLPLTSPLSDYVPTFAKMQLGRTGANGEVKLEPAMPILIHDLLRHTSGIPYGAFGDSAAYKAFPATSTSAAIAMTGDEFLARLAATPLLDQPGTVWEYGLSTDVLGLVIEKISGQRLGAYLARTVWDKVGMPDTGFGVAKVDRKRLALPFAKNPLSGREQAIPIFDKPIKFDCGGGCAVGTVGDYLRFGQMLLNGGIIDGKRVLSPYSVRAMTSDHLGPHIKNTVAVDDPLRDGYGFGLGVAVRMRDGAAVTPGSPGEYNWNGAYGTVFWADPKERLVVVLGAVTPGAARKHYRDQLGALVYGAMLPLGTPPK